MMKFADPIDEAAEREQQYLNIALESRPSPKPFTGFCSYCKDNIDKGHYCDDYCRSCDEKHQRAKVFNRH